MKIIDLYIGTSILAKYVSDFDMDTIPKCFPDSTPAHTYDCYISVEVYAPLKEEDARRLMEHNWKPQQDGDVWIYGNYYVHNYKDSK